jgi:PTS system mannitol-specific IIC component
MEGLKGKKSSISSALVGSGATANAGPIRTIVFACDAGMGSSAMGASVLRNKIKAAGFPEVKVTNSAIANLTDSYDLVVTHQDLAARAEPATASAIHVAVDNFMNSPRYDEIVELVREKSGTGSASGGTAATGTAAGPVAAATAAPRTVTDTVTDSDVDEAPAGSDVLDPRSVVLSGRAIDRDSAIDEAGQLLMDRGAVSAAYVRAMHEREESVATYMGNFLAIPHGTNEAKSEISHSAVSVIRYPEGIDWNGKPVKFVVGIAGVNKEHLSILSSIARVFSDKEQVARLDAAETVDDVLEIFGKVNAR